MKQMKRYYIVDVDETALDTINCTNEEFITEAEKQGTVYQSNTKFVEDFNNGTLNTFVHQLRII